MSCANLSSAKRPVVASCPQNEGLDEKGRARGAAPAADDGAQSSSIEIAASGGQSEEETTLRNQGPIPDPLLVWRGDK